MKDAETGLDIRTTQETFTNPQPSIAPEPVTRRFEANYSDEHGYTFTVWVEHERNFPDELAAYVDLRQRAVAAIEACLYG